MLIYRCTFQPSIKCAFSALFIHAPFRGRETADSYHAYGYCSIYTRELMICSTQPWKRVMHSRRSTCIVVNGRAWPSTKPRRLALPRLVRLCLASATRQRSACGNGYCCIMAAVVVLYRDIAHRNVALSHCNVSWTP